MKTLADLHIEQQQKEKKTKTILIVLIAIFTLILGVLFTIDPWEIANNKAEKVIKEREDEFSLIYKDFLDEGKYVEAFYLISDLSLYEITPDLYSLLSDSERIIEYVANQQEGRSSENYYSLDYLMDSFNSEYAYQKKYGVPSNYVEDIKNVVEEYLKAYNYISQDDLEVDSYE